MTNEHEISMAGQTLPSSAVLGCPWCGSDKIMAEGTGKVIAMVCQKCGAHGPEDRNAGGNPENARTAWDNRIESSHKKTAITIQIVFLCSIPICALICGIESEIQNFFVESVTLWGVWLAFLLEDETQPNDQAQRPAE
ncbi:MAG: hypothetical protein KGL39_43795 [Patescibacteria group bacterium]|nr:hypothetical protein [Patescibacteria group bacterium]